MMRNLLVLALMLLFPGFGMSATVLKSPDTELRDSLHHLKESVEEKKTLSYEDAVYIKYFSTYAVPNELREATETTLPFILNSCMSFEAVGDIAPIYRATDTLWYIDIRNYGWKLKDFDLVFGQDPYFAAPMVRYDHVKNYERFAANLVLRADWFIVYASDVTKQSDNGEPNILYYILLYGSGKEPKTGTDFRKAWQVDIKTIRAQRVEYGMIIDEDYSGVSRHTRQLSRGRTIFGYYWATKDVIDYEKKRINAQRNQAKFIEKDFITDIFARNFDAQELIASHKNGLQVYLLTDGQDNRIEDANAGIVIDRTDPKDHRVRTGKGCIVCHAVGINPGINALSILYKKGAEILTKKKELSDIIKAYYLNNNAEDSVEDDNRIFERAIRKCNGLDPIENAIRYTKVYNWYMSRVSTEQAAKECGVTLQQYLDSISVSIDARLVQLFHREDVPRRRWDSLNSGSYQQSVLHIKGLKQKEKILVIRTKFDNVPVYEFQPGQLKGILVDKILRKETIIRFYKKDGEWYQIGNNQWIYETSIEIVEVYK